MSKKSVRKKSTPVAGRGYTGLLGGIGELLEAARRASARTVNAFMTATYWEVGRRIVEFEQGGKGEGKGPMRNGGTRVTGPAEGSSGRCGTMRPYASP